MEPVPTHYLDRDGAALAYQVVGDGPVDVVAAYELGMHLDLCWTDPDIHRNYERLAGFSRFACFQPRGFGLSDQITYTPTIEQQADDMLAVMDAVGMRRATLMGNASTCGAAALLAAQVPERVHGLVLFMPVPYGWEAREDTHGWTASDVDAFLGDVQHAVGRWGTGETINIWGPSWASNLNRRLSAMLERSSATPAAAQKYMEAFLDQDVRDVYRSVQVPTRVLWLSGCLCPEAYGRYTAGLIPGASYHLLPEAPMGSSIGQAFVPIFDHLEEAATGTPHSADADRFLGTVVFTDVVASTEVLASVGDAKYQDMRANHERLVRLEVEGRRWAAHERHGRRDVECVRGTQHGGANRGVDLPGRGRRWVADPGRCPHRRAAARRDERHRHVGAHRRPSAVRLAGPGEVWVSRTVHDLVTGSGLTFASRGEQELKGVRARGSCSR